MLIDARELAADSVLRADVCIVGAGAAGITLARRLAGGQRDVLLLESGGFEADDGTQALARGDVVGEPLGFFGDTVDLDFTRLRYFGGSTNHWGGWCHPLSPVDLDRRSDVPSSGWPFGWDELAPWYEPAREICGLGPFPFDPGWWTPDRLGTRALETDRLTTAVMQISSPPLRFGETYRDELVDAGNVRVCIRANVVDLRSEGERVTAAEVAVLDGPRFRVEADTFVVATGGVEVPRLLLSSRQDRPAGLGNANDLVGRYFADHPHLDCRIALALPREDLTAYVVGFREVEPPDPVAGTPPEPPLVSGALLPGPDAPDLHRRMAALLTVFDAGAAADPFRPDEEGDAVTSDDVAALTSSVRGRPAGVSGLLTFRAEQEPNPSSQVRLTGDRDALGMPRVELDWRLTGDDRASYARTMDLVAHELGRTGTGRLHTVVDGERVADRPVGVGCHHMGTARMHASPRQGVVDPHCRVHGTANLYVAGSAVFPTYGWVNPTLTIVALTLRLASHLGEERS